MPEVYFELLGDSFNPSAAIAGSPLLEFADIQRKGESTGLTRDPACETSGLQIWVGGDETAGLEEQITQALRFLREDAQEIRRLRHFPGVDCARLRFGDHWPEKIAAHCPRLPSELLLACGELGLDIVLSQYLLEKFPNEESPSA